MLKIMKQTSGRNCVKKLMSSERPEIYWAVRVERHPRRGREFIATCYSIGMVFHSIAGHLLMH